MKTILISLLFSTMAIAQTKPTSQEVAQANERLYKMAAVECNPAAWPYKRKQSDAELHLLFNKLPRNTLVQFLFGEVTSPRDQLVAYPLVRYLSRTESNPNLSAFFDLIEASAQIGDNMGKPDALDRKEVCDLYRKALALPLPQGESKTTL